jgi:hypothetical protein
VPGIYVNDGGATSSALGSILGNIATNVGPEAAAKAQLLSQQTQGADISNQDAYEKLLAGEAAARGAPGLARTLQMDAPDPGAVAPSVASTAAALAQPPSATPGPGGRISRIDESGYTPEQAYLANEILNGRMSPAALQTGVDVFQTPLVGAGNTPSAVRTRATTPLSPGQTITTTGQAGGPTISGGSVYDEGVAKGESTANPVEAERDTAEGNAAVGNLGKMQKILAVYDAYVAPNTDPAGILSEEIKKRLSEATGIDLSRFTTTADARNEIQKMFAGMVVNLRDSQGQPMFKGGIDQIMQQFPDAKADPARFRSSLDALTTSLDRQVKDGNAAFEYRKNETRENFIKYQEQKRANAIAEGNAYARAGLDISKNAAPATAPAAAPAAAPKLTPADQPTVQRARVKLQQANNDPAVRQRIIDAGKANGVDLEAGGF